MRILAILIGVGVLGFVAFNSLADDVSLTALTFFSTQSTHQCISEIQESYTKVEQDVFEVTRADLNGDSKKDFIVKINDAELCGSAGCIYELCIFDAVGELSHISFGFAATNIKPLETLTNGMRDLEINGDKTLRLEWNTKRYERKQ